MINQARKRAVAVNVADSSIIEFSSYQSSAPGADLGFEKTSCAGTIIGARYQVSSLIGMGASSSVYKATDSKSGKAVAIKILHEHLSNNPDSVKRFENEGLTQRLLQHPNIARVRHNGRLDNGQPYLVMEYVDGVSLQDALQATGSLAVGRSIQIFSQVCAALAAAHEKHIVHRDLKPGNIMLTTTADGRLLVKLLDFGIAKFSSALADTNAYRLTQNGQMLGSILYMSPEQCLDRDLDERSDCYSAACVLYEILTGKPPLCARTAFETMNRHISNMPESLSRVRPDIQWPLGLQEVLFKALAKQPKDRYQKITQFGDDLQAVRLGLQPGNLKVIRPVKKHVVVGVAATAFVGSLLLNIWLMKRTPDVFVPAISATPIIERQVVRDERNTFYANPSNGIDGEPGGAAVNGMNGTDGLPGTSVMPSNKATKREILCHGNEQLLLSPDKKYFHEFAGFLKEPETGLIRLLPRETYEKRVKIRGGGAFYSFARRSQEYGYGSDIELTDGKFKVGFAGADYGFFTELGDDESLKDINVESPAVAFMDQFEPAEDRRDLYFCSGYESGGSPYANSVRAELGQTYALRSISPGRSDTLVVFKVVGQDSDGSQIILWKILNRKKALPES